MDLVPRLLHPRARGQNGMVLPGRRAGGIAAIMAHPYAREQVMQIARNVGNHLGETARNWYNNVGQDDGDDDTQQMEPDSTSDQTTQNDAGAPVEARSGANSSIGALGVFKGNTSTKIGFEKYFFERDVFHTRKIHNRDLLWGFSAYPIPDVNGNYLKLKKWGPGSYGNVYRPEVTGNDTSTLNLFNMFSSNTGDNKFEYYVSPSDHCYSHAINFSVGDFIDKKVLSEKGGALRNFLKVRLLKFAVKIQFITRTYNSYELNSGLYHIAERDSGASPTFSVHQNLEASSHLTQQHNYYVYRDKNGDYINPENKYQIPNVPPDANPNANEDKITRTCHQIRAFDNNLCVCSDREPFYFEREIKSQGTYFIPPGRIWELRTFDIATLVNTIENQFGSSNIIQNEPEYYSLLVVPCNVSWFQSNLIPIYKDQRGHVLMAGQSTQLALTYTATWQGYNYNHKGEMQFQTIETKTDPYEIAEMHYNAGETLFRNQALKGL